MSSQHGSNFHTRSHSLVTDWDHVRINQGPLSFAISLSSTPPTLHFSLGENKTHNVPLECNTERIPRPKWSAQGIQYRICHPFS